MVCMRRLSPVEVWQFKVTACCSTCFLDVGKTNAGLFVHALELIFGGF